MPLHKITFNLTDKAHWAVERGSRQSGYTKTDYLNRAAQVYDFILEQEAAGRTLWVHDGDKMAQVKIF
jgi:hypothetical protein